MLATSVAQARLVVAQREDEGTVDVGGATAWVAISPPRERGVPPLADGAEFLEDGGVELERVGYCLGEVKADDLSEKGTSTPTPLAAAFAVRTMVCMK